MLCSFEITLACPNCGIVGHAAKSRLLCKQSKRSCRRVSSHIYALYRESRFSESRESSGAKSPVHVHVSPSSPSTASRPSAIQATQPSICSWGRRSDFLRYTRTLSGVESRAIAAARGAPLTAAFCRFAVFTLHVWDGEKPSQAKRGTLVSSSLPLLLCSSAGPSARQRTILLTHDAFAEGPSKEEAGGRALQAAGRPVNRRPGTLQ